MDAVVAREGGPSADGCADRVWSGCDAPEHCTRVECVRFRAEASRKAGGVPYYPGGGTGIGVYYPCNPARWSPRALLADPPDPLYGYVVGYQVCRPEGWDGALPVPGGPVELGWLPLFRAAFPEVSEETLVSVIRAGWVVRLRLVRGVG